MARAYWVGTSGWSYEHWSGIFYPPELPQSRWLQHYASCFNTVEVNNTFYRLPKEGAWRRWALLAPTSFRYAVKGSRFITHIKRLRDVEGSVQLFLGRASLLGESLGPVLWQLPPSLRRDDDLLSDFLALLPRDVRHVFEFRHRSWLERDVFFLLRMHNAGFCAYHMVDWETPLEATTDFAYVRFHGSGSLYGGNYSDDDLGDWAARIRSLPEDVGDVYCYFNNDAFGYAVDNALLLRRLLAA